MAEKFDRTQLVGVLSEFFPDGRETGNSFKVLCPFHEDTKPSGMVTLASGRFKCLACGATGDVYRLVAAKLGRGLAATKKFLRARLGGVENPLVVSMELVELYHRNLTRSKKMQATLARKGITMETAVKRRLGMDGDRITIPVYDRNGNVANIRKYKPDAKDRKTINMKGFGAARLYPLDSLEAEDEWIIVTEGEMKALLLCQLGLHGISPTGGVATWKEEWTEEFRDKRVAILFDIDKAGRTATAKIIRRLFPVAREVKDVVLPLNTKEFPKGDITDYVQSQNADVTDVRSLIASTAEWSPTTLADDVIDDERVYKVHLAEASRAKWHGKFIDTQVVVSAKDTAPYIVPQKFTVACTKDKDYCIACPVFNAEDAEPQITIDPRRAVLLEMIGVHRDRLDRILKKAAGIPQKCDACIMRVNEMANIEELRLIPQINVGKTDEEHVVRRAFYVGHGIETNAPYKIEARVVPDPNTQYATLIIYEAEAAVDSLSTFKLTKKLQEKLERFRPDAWSEKGLADKLEEIHADFEANVTRIYQRRDLHLFVDLIYHSVLYFNFQDKQEKGWSEGLIIGDSGQGKSDTTSLLQKHYGLGEKIDTKGATVAGLVGGAQETAKRWFITWGIIPLNDRRLVILEEIKGMHPEVIAKMTDMRSSGIAEIIKIESAKTHARCRLIWVSNPRSDRQILSYNYGVQAIKELMGSLEDVRRFDMAIVVASGEVDRRWLNIESEDRPKRRHRYNSEACRNLILWAWSRKNDQIVITKAAEKAILKHASAMGKKYSAEIPLVEAADHRLKLARLSTALAARTFSTDDGEVIVVRPCHIEYIAKFMQRLYSAPAFGYESFSASLKGEEELHDADEVRVRVGELPHAKDTVRSLLNAETMTPFDFADWTGWELDKCREIISFLVRKNAIARGRRSYVKSPAFIALLKEMQLNGLTNETAYDKTSGEEF